MDLHYSLQALGIDDLADITLNELEDKIQHANPDQIPKKDVLQAFMGWLHERIKRDIQQESLLLEFANLLLTGGKLQQGPFTEDEVEEALKEWQVKDASENPANIRRYQMVQLDIHELFVKYKRGSELVKNLSPRSSTCSKEGHSLSHVNKLINSQATAEIRTRESTASWVLGGGKQKTGANEIPLGRKAGTRANIYNEIIKIKEDNNKKKNLNTVIKAPLTKQTAKPSTRGATSRDSSPAKTYESILSDYSSANMPSYLTTSPPYGYICKRCDRPGHWIQLCPTNLDPSWDQPPPQSYRCEICKVSGKHFATLCPRNEYELSLTQQRLRIKARPKTPTWDKHSYYRDRSPFTPSPRGRSRSPIYPSRRRKHNANRRDESPENRSHNSRGRYQSHNDRRNVSPWTARERMAQEAYHREESPQEYSLGSYRIKKRPATPPRDHRKRARAPLPEERPRPFLSLNKTKGGMEEGRLGYDNDEFMGSQVSPATPKDVILPENRFLGTIEGTDELMLDAASVSEDTAEDIEKARKEANAFLDALAIEIFSGNMQALPPANDIPTDDHLCQSDKMDIDGNKENHDLNEDDITLAEIADQHLQGTQFQPEVISLFKGQTIPIVHNMANKKTAREMIKEAWKPT
ncbi:hypothetical protein Daesc_000401 [Daldinia eschscholtzii]|uniref:Zinc knuckle CX2CX3GHX4C domain-containing protein n=1 Tax=Daldinia eschscholtzii TaxID=292717 RepID=A0AAX6MYN8_9PEZI